MPAFLENILQKEASKQGFSGKQANHYIYGAMNNMGAIRGNKITAKGRSMQRKHNAKMKMVKLPKLRSQP